MNYNDFLNNQKNEEIDLSKPKQKIIINDRWDSLNIIKTKLIDLENALFDERNRNVSKVSEIIELVQYLQRNNN